MLLHYLSYVAVLAAFAFVTLSLASGLLYISELIEEHSRVAKSIGKKGIYVIIILHVLLCFSDSLPLPRTLFSIFCHIVYLQNFSSTWPTISLMSLTFVSSCVLVVSDHFLWFFYFARLSQEARQKSQRMYGSPASMHKAPGFAEITTFFGICVWLAPLFLFLSLSANDNALPISSGEPSTPTSTSMPVLQPRTSLFKTMFSVLSSNSLPRLRPRGFRRDTSEGIIAPRSPVPTMTSFLPPSSPRESFYNIAPPGTPTSIRKSGDFDAHLSPQTGFTLGTPPRRGAQLPRANSELIGLGLRRASAAVSAAD